MIVMLDFHLGLLALGSEGQEKVHPMTDTGRTGCRLPRRSVGQPFQMGILLNEHQEGVNVLILNHLDTCGSGRVSRVFPLSTKDK